jgi:hypothetical protein
MPDWRPLIEAVGEVVAGDFMWMFEVELTNGTRLQGYKHIDTRRYVHLDPDGAAFIFEPPDRYQSFPLPDVLAAVFATLPRLRGVTADQVSRSWAVVERLESGRPSSAL